ncbi:39S ribosomal protein L22, mitochondrial [Pseudolycoriella hygida]|uniref:Large ribosomal subunit protein uL22m n=1 Tax=Pseudolycoriella hygida TaxID=35572 RepID=A0A9Q0MYK4_9DIPT|nr:39S ribosomal protein L22, mitochondrial [Pseudolycoriella hygida]
MNIPRSLSQLFLSNLRPATFNKTPQSFIHLNSTLLGYLRPNGPRKFELHNKKIYPPQAPNEEPRPAFVCHVKQNFRYSPDKMWYIAVLVRGMTVDEAVRQLSFVATKGSDVAKQTILEAQELAVKHHNVEFKSNLWISESFVTKGVYFKGVRRHARGRRGEVEYKHCHYFVTLEEGTPPVDYYRQSVTPEAQLDKFMEQLRKRKVSNSL